MLKVLLISPTFGIDKSNKVQAMMSAYKTAHYLSKKAHIIVLAAGPKASYEKINNNLEVHQVKSLYLKDPINYVISPSILWKTIKLVRQEKPDIFLINKIMFFNAFTIPILRLMGKRVITQVDAFPSIDWTSRTPWIRPIMWLYLRLIAMPLLWLSNCVILFHEGMVPIAKKFHLKYKVIHNGVNTSEFIQVTTATELGKKISGEIHLGYVGRLESMKGYDILLKACKELLPAYPSATLYVVGNTSGKEKILNEYKSPQIKFLGIRHDIPQILKGIDIFILPSFSEGLSNSLMEAMASKCACIASDIPGGNRILIQDNINGLLVRKGDKIDLVRKIEYLLKNPKKRKMFGIKAHEKIYKFFNWENITQDYLELFNKNIQK